MIGSLFSGIGGLELGLEWAGLGRVAWQVEIDPYCRAILARHWPDAERYSDVKSVGSAVLSPVRVVCGGFPCQDLSVAGKRAGLAGARSGLWYEYLRVLGELRPAGVVIENVPGLHGRALDEVVSGLYGLGYAVEGARIRASDLGAPHRRERVFLLAYSDRLREQQPGGELPDERRRARDDGEGLAYADACGADESRREPGADREGPPTSERRGDMGDARGLRRRPRGSNEPAPNSRPLREQAGTPGICLNPAWVEQLMGFPPGWTAGPPAEERPSTPGRRRARSRRAPCPTEGGG